MSIDLKDLVNKVAKKHSIPIMRAENAAHMQFSFIRHMIASGELKSVILINLGKILVKPKKKDLLIRYNELKKKQIESGQNITRLGEFAKAYRYNRDSGKGENANM